MKKVLGVHAFLVGLALAAVMHHGNVVSAADRISADNIVVDYATQSLRITTTDDEVMAAFPAVTFKNGEINSVQVSKWDIYDADYMQEAAYPEDAHEVTIDISSINITKGGYVALRTNTTNGINLIHFSGIRNKLAASYDMLGGIVTVIDKDDGNNECESRFEYKTQYGNWQDYDQAEVSLRRYEQQGATLYFREKCGYEDGGEYISQGSLSNSVIANRVGTVAAAPDFVLYEATNTFSGRELKVKIPRRKNGPAVRINYAKRTITVGRNMEYRQDSSSAFEETPVDESLEVEIGDEAGALEVRTLAVEGKKYVPASKIARYEYPSSRIMKVADDAEGYVGKKAGKLTVTYNSKSKKVELVSTDMENTYLVYVVRDDGDIPVAGDKATTTVNPAVSASKARIISLAPARMPAGSQIYVAYAANAGKKQWATIPVLLGEVE